MRRRPTTDLVGRAARASPVPSVDLVEGARRFAVWVEVSDGVTVVSKQGWGAVASASLQREAAILGAFRHPGVVDLVTVDSAGPIEGNHTRLSTRFAGSHTLLTAPPATPALHVLRAGQLLATLAALHARGLAHGAVEPSHVVVGPTGSARWCGLGRVRAAPAAVLADETLAVADLATRALATARLPRHRASQRARNERHLVADASAILADGRLDAAGLASALTSLLPPGPAHRPQTPRRGSAQADGHLVGEQSAGDGEDEMLATPFHQTIEHAADLRR